VHLFRVSRRGAERCVAVLRHRDEACRRFEEQRRVKKKVLLLVYEDFQGSMLVPRCRRGQRARSARERQTLNRSGTAHPKLLCDGAALRVVACVSRFVSRDSCFFCGLCLEIRVVFPFVVFPIVTVVACSRTSNEICSWSRDATVDPTQGSWQRNQQD
jgi:hypothetical protein